MAVILIVWEPKTFSAFDKSYESLQKKKKKKTPHTQICINTKNLHGSQKCPKSHS